MKIGTRLGTVAVISFVAVLAVLPLALLFVYSFGRSWFWPQIAPKQWDVSAWRYVFSEGSGVLSSTLVSAVIAVIVSLVAIVISLPAARVLAWREFRGKKAVLFFLLLPVLAPPLAAAMGVHRLFLWIGLAETNAGVLLVHLIPALPYVVLMLASSFSRVDPDMEAQARTLGASASAVFRYITLPAIAPGIAVAAAFAFLISWSQYLLTVLIGGGRVLTLPITLVAFQRGGDEAIAAALCLVFIFPTLAVFIAVGRYLRYEA